MTKIRYIGPSIVLKGHLATKRDTQVMMEIETNQVFEAKIPHTHNGYCLIAIECLVFPGCVAEHFIYEG